MPPLWGRRFDADSRRRRRFQKPSGRARAVLRPCCRFDADSRYRRCLRVASARARASSAVFRLTGERHQDQTASALAGQSSRQWHPKKSLLAGIEFNTGPAGEPNPGRARASSGFCPAFLGPDSTTVNHTQNRDGCEKNFNFRPFWGPQDPFFCPKKAKKVPKSVPRTTVCSRMVYWIPSVQKGVFWRAIP
jgi:hypothetical protein